MEDVCGVNKANYTVWPVFARCLILVARVVFRERYNRFLAALILLSYPGAHSRDLAVGNNEKGNFYRIFPTTFPCLNEGGVESSWGRNFCSGVASHRR